jgi:hypothetical protein
MTDLQQLVDRAAIMDVLAGLASAQDHKDWSALRALFADVVRLDLSAHLGDAPYDLPGDELVARNRAALAGFAATHHTTSNIRITIEGERAVAQAHVIAYHHIPTEPGIADFCTVRGYWDVKLRCTDGHWLVDYWRIERAGPVDGYAGVYQLAAAASERS